MDSLLDSLARQTYDLSLLEVVIADGGSTDGTVAAISAWASGKPLRVRALDNPQSVTATGLNAGIAATDAPIVIILGAHAEVPEDFVERSVSTLRSSSAMCVGGSLETDGGATATGRAIAAATTSPFGVGNTLFRTGTAARRNVDTVAFGAYRREVFEQVGDFDAALVGAEDDELNFRVIRSGATILFDPTIRARYFCRTTLRGLARQYFMYGRGKAWVLRKHHRPPSVRMLAPAALVAGVAAGSVGALALRRPMLALVPVLPYLSVVAVGARRAQHTASDAPRGRIAAALVIIHISYGIGLFVGVLRRPPASPTRSN